MALLGNLTGSAQYFSDGDFYSGAVTQSLRLDDGDSGDKLSLTHGSAGNQKTWTWSGWVKRSLIGNSSMLYSQFTSNTDVSWLYFNASDQLNMQSYEGANQVDIKTNAKFRDASSWYHVMAVLDTTQGTNTNRAKMYVNGELQTSLASTTYPSQNADLKLNSADAALVIGSTPDSYGTGAGYKFDGYLAEVNFVDGIALDASYFGETKNGVWIPKKYTGSYGTNGFRLQFNQTGVGTASTSTIGADTSGNANHLTSANIVASDCNMPDCPENNFATMNPLDNYNTGVTYSEGNLKWTIGSADGAGRATFVMTSGKWYTEFLTNADYIGVVSGNADITTVNGTQTVFYAGDGTKRVNGSSSSYGASYSDGDIIGIALNMDDNEVTFYKNNSSQGTISLTSVDNEGYTVSPGSGAGSKNATANFGQDSSFAGAKTAQGNTDGNGIGDFYYAPPSGYLALCTANLPEPTIGPNSDTQSDDNFNTVLYTGNGSSSSATQDISGVGFKPDWLWIKRRNSSASHNLRDSSRGVLKHLQSDGTGAEDEESDAGVTAFLDDGFRLKGTNAGTGQVNANGGTFVAWNWKANGGTKSTNDDGSIQSAVQVNATAGFSIVTYTGTGSNATVGHGLGAVPDWYFVRRRSNTGHWQHYHGKNTSNPETDSLRFTSDGTVDYPYWNDTSPTSSVFSLGDHVNVNASGNQTYVAYVFAEVEGYSKFGSYTANENTDGVFIYLGFRPAWAMIKRTAGNGWAIQDSARSTFNIVSNLLEANATNAEYTTGVAMDFVSNGIKHRNNSGYFNHVSGDSFIYMAFAEAPFKYANAR